MKALKNLISVFVVVLIATSCDKTEDVNLSQTIFIEDPYAPGLPVYSEWGYNTFGAYIDRIPFVSNSQDLPLKVIVNSDTLKLIFQGTMGYETVEMDFLFKGYSPASYAELIDLDNTLFNLKDESCTVILRTGDSAKLLNLIEGDFQIQRAQRLFVDESLNRTILSGTFRFKTFLDGEPVAITNGRFDAGVGYENFYNF
ncbi:MAG: hypothetical protein JNL22_07645 [Bacteroidales bacterium]|nr:hypothetical protein [Bacteroidales bacterium]